ncbi:T-complex protein 1 subunit delta [Coelomomyces lativittatus]|nr:T-complex protein 1 subunit delta [Coelomomyces lativittatus]
MVETSSSSSTATSMKTKAFKDKSKPEDVRKSNIIAAKAVADAIRTSLGPRGMDKMIQTSKGEVIITNDGATILKHMSVLHPAARMLVDLSAAQDVEAGDGTTSVVIIAGSLLVAAEKMLSKGCKPIADIESFTDDKLGYADVVEEVQELGNRYVKFSGAKQPSKTVSVIVRGANGLVLDEAERSLHDALCVIRCLVKKRALIAGGGAAEIEVSHQLMNYAKSISGMQSYCYQAFAEALEVIPVTLAENAGLNTISIVTELRNRHANGEKAAGINVRKGSITNILEENVVQPLLVSTSAIELASDTVRMVLKIDDIVTAR